VADAGLESSVSRDFEPAELTVAPDGRGLTSNVCAEAAAQKQSTKHAASKQGNSFLNNNYLLFKFFSYCGDKVPREGIRILSDWISTQQLAM